MPHSSTETSKSHDFRREHTAQKGRRALDGLSSCGSHTYAWLGRDPCAWVWLGIGQERNGGGHDDVGTKVLTKSSVATHGQRHSNSLADHFLRVRLLGSRVARRGIMPSSRDVLLAVSHVGTFQGCCIPTHSSLRATRRVAVSHVAVTSPKPTTTLPRHQHYPSTPRPARQFTTATLAPPL